MPNRLNINIFIFQVSRCCILVAHSACIWDIKNLPFKDLDMADSTYTNNSSCHEVSFATCSADGTIRQWDLALLGHPKSSLEQRELISNQLKCSVLDEHLFSSVQLGKISYILCDYVHGHVSIHKDMHYCYILYASAIFSFYSYI